MKNTYLFIKKLFFLLLFFIILLIIFLSFLNYIFKPIFITDTLIFPYAINPFDIVKLYPQTWQFIKKYFIGSSIYTYSMIYLYFSIPYLRKNSQLTNNNEYSNFSYNPNVLSLKIGEINSNIIYIPEKSLYQNILITGTIGTGKTSSAMYPFTRDLLLYKHDNPREKLAFLILDVKGNFLKQVNEFLNDYPNRKTDIITIDLNNNLKYNPLDKPNISPIVLANRLKTILSLFSKESNESYWLDKAEQILSESIKFCRLYNDGYVTFKELHKLINSENYYKEKLNIIKNKYLSNQYNNQESFEILSSIDFFEKEFFSLDQRTLSILKSEISRITNIFVSDYNVSKTFCPSKKEISFNGFREVINSGKIVVLNMNIAEYKNLSKIIAAYLKLDFQAEVLSRLSSNNKNSIRRTVFISDEYQEYVTASDADFYAQSREAKCINIIATQSYTSILNTLKDERSTKVILQNLINKIWFRTDDDYTIELAQKQRGKEEKEKHSTTISENAKETNYNFLTNRLSSTNTNISESYNKYTEFNYIYDSNYFSRELKTFEALCFLSNGDYILNPQKIKLIPYFYSTSNIISNTPKTQNNHNKKLFKINYKKLSKRRTTHENKKEKIKFY